MSLDEKWVEHLQRDVCLGLLAAQQVGRLAVIVDDAPEIYPVNHVVDGDTVVFRTSPGTKLDGLVHNARVCYEVDEVDETDQTGWSVLVKGRASEIVDPLEVEQAAMLPLHLWEFGDQTNWIRIRPTEVTGRRIWRR